MIRFCDREVGCVEYGSLNRGELISYFISEHIDDMVVVYDSFNTMRFVGIITYRSLLSAINMDSAIQDEYVILNQNIWGNTRDYFDKKGKIGSIIPVLDEKYQLVCFAYMDDEANREIRMLRELSEHSEAVHFTDLFPEYQCVKIYDFNELAYFFVEYLRGQNVAVQVEGAMWQFFLTGNDCEVPDYACLSIYAEGIIAKKQNLLENLLRSVSVEFECIDQIYEMNIKKGIFRNTDGEWEDLAERLRRENQIVIIGTGLEAQRTYGFLKKNGIDICCFMGEHHHKMFGKDILSYIETRNIYKSAVYIECISKGSAWGIGGTDHYDYVGCERNKRFILLKDYVEVPDDSIIDALRSRKIGLIGDLYLCRRLAQYLEQNMVNVVECLGKTPQEEVFQGMSEKAMNYRNLDMTWLFIAPVIYDWETTWKKENEQILAYCQEKEIHDYTDYFSYIEAYIDVESKNSPVREYLMPKKIVIGSIDDHSGNVFFRGLLDGHPSILMFSEYGVSLNNNLFWICASLSTESSQNILPLFWRVYEKIATEIVYNKESFNMKMNELLMSSDRFTSQELFVMFHIAYMYMEGKDITESDINQMVLYWEPHNMPRKFVDDCAKWLGGEGSNLSCCVLNIARNLCMRMGSRIKGVVMKKMAVSKTYVLDIQSVDKKDYEDVDRLTVRFEDLKCNSEEILLNICDKWGIPWVNSLMKTTKHGEKLLYNNGERVVSDFDLGPVYDVYEKFFSAFDRLRIMIFNAPFQKKHGYPYIELAQFSRRELQEMFLKQFRYEGLVELNGDKELEIKIQKTIRDSLQKIRMYELLW